MDDLTKNQRRFLSRRVCALCDMPLDRDGCGAIFQQCSEQVRKDRRERCLATYKPRTRRPTQEEREDE